MQALQDDSYRLIRELRSGLGATLAAHWKGLAEPKSAGLDRVMPWWVVATAAAVLVIRYADHARVPG